MLEPWNRQDPIVNLKALIDLTHNRTEVINYLKELDKSAMNLYASIFMMELPSELLNFSAEIKPEEYIKLSFQLGLNNEEVIVRFLPNEVELIYPTLLNNERTLHFHHAAFIKQSAASKFDLFVKLMYAVDFNGVNSVIEEFLQPGY